MSRVALPTRIQGALEYIGDGYYKLWLHTIDYVHGTFLVLYPNGTITRITVRDEEGDECVVIRPKGEP